MAKIKFEDFSQDCINKLHKAAWQFLEEAGAEVESGARDRVRVDTGWTKRNYKHHVDKEGMCCYVGSNVENAIWEEFGTGRYAEAGNGRKTPWAYEDPKTGEVRWTRGKAPMRPLRGSYEKLRPAIKKRAQEIYKSLD